MKNFLLLLMLLQLFACNDKKAEQNSKNDEQQNSSNNVTPTTNSCDIYLGTWIGKDPRTNIIYIKPNGTSYIVEEDGPKWSGSPRTLVGECDNGLLKIEHFTLAFVQDGGYILLDGIKFYPETHNINGNSSSTISPSDNNSTSSNNNAYSFVLAAINEKVYFYSRAEESSILSSYIVKGQKVIVSDVINDFWKVKFNYNGTTTTGFMRTSDLN